MKDSNGWTGGQYSLFRVIFGVYLLVHFIQLLPYGAELFSNQGVVPDGSASPLLHLFPNVFALCDAPGFVSAVVFTAVSLSFLLLIGYCDRAAALSLWYIIACMLGRNPLITNPGLPYVGLLLLVHAALPPAPYGSYTRARLNESNPDPGTGWRMPQQLFNVVWILMAVGYTYSGVTKLLSPSWVNGTAIDHVLHNPLARPGFLRDLMLMLPASMSHLVSWGALGLELTFLFWALFRTTRPWIWTLLMGMHISLIGIINFADLSLGMVMLHLFTFDPGWIKGLELSPVAAPALKGTVVGSATSPAVQGSVAAPATTPVLPGSTSSIMPTADLVFFDGGCGLCHGAVQFLLVEDPSGKFHFAPLDSEVFNREVPAAMQVGLPDSMVVVTGNTRQTGNVQLLLRSDAWVYLLQRLGGIWRLMGMMLGVLPRAIRDRVYDGIASMRKLIWAAPAAMCPMMPPALRDRFEH